MRLTNDILDRKTEMFTAFDQKAKNYQLCQEMLAFMHKQKGIGLSAPQIGLDLRLFVMCIWNRVYCCYNPEILERKGDLIESKESCLSFPGKACKIKRNGHITVRYQDHHGRYQTHDLLGLAAICFQHELDHLDGITMWDHQKERHAEQP